MHINNRAHARISKGFIALIAVMSIVSGVLAYSYVSMMSVWALEDSVMRHEWRIQANLNAQSCLSTSALMAAKDYFLSGDVFVSEFGCMAHIVRDHIQGTASIKTTAVFSGISSSDFEQIFNIP